MERITDLLTAVPGPHQGAELFVFGQMSKKALILLHGRGGSVADISSLYEVLQTDVYTLIPEAVANSWYPERFMQPQADNQPALDSALAVITVLLNHLDALGIKKADTVIAGFSQGACLAAEYVKRQSGRFGGVVLMSGGFIGTDDEAVKLSHTRSLEATRVYIGSDQSDFHIPLTRVQLTAEKLQQMGADVTLEVFTDYGHRPHSTAFKFLQAILKE